MNQESSNSLVIDKIEQLAASAIAEVVVPQFDHRGRNSRGHRWGLLGVAAAAALIAAIGIGWRFLGNEELRTTDTTAPVTVPAGGRLVPTYWPPSVRGDVTARDPEPPSVEMFEHDVLSYEGDVAVTLASFDYPMGQSDDPTRDEVFELDGMAAKWISGELGSSLHVALAPGRTVVLSSRTAERDQLEALASPLVAADGDPEAAELQRGWAVVPDPAGVADVLANGGTGGEWSTVHRGPYTAEGGLQVSTRTVDDAEAAVALAGQLAGPDATPIEIDRGHDGLLIELPARDSAESFAVLWAPNPEVVAVALSTNIETAELLSTVRSTRTVPQDEWDALKEPDDAFPQKDVAGFEIPESSEVIGSGEDFGVTWLVTQSPFERAGRSTVVTSLSVRDTEGFQGTGGSGGSGGGVVGTAYSRLGSYVALETQVPSDSTDVTIEILGQRHRTVRVPLPGGRTDFVFTILPARDTPDVGGDAIVHATLPDGTRITSPPDSIPE